MLEFKMDSTKFRNRKEASKMPSAIPKHNVAYRGVDEFKHQIAKLTSDLSSERTRNRELHREKLTELKRAKNELEIHKEKSALINKALDSNVDPQLLPKRDLTFHKQADYSWNESERSPAVGGEVIKSRTSSSSSHRPLSSIYASTIANLQQELHLLRDSKRQLEQRLAGIEGGSAVLFVQKERDFTPDLSFLPFDRSYNDFDISVQSIDDNCFNATTSSASPQLIGHRTSDKSNSTFVIDSEFEHSRDEVSARRQSQSVSSVGSEQSVDKQVKGDSEKQWQLQRKVLDLSAQSTQLEKRITALKEENDVLKKKTEEQKENEEKAKKLKRRNAELASIARRLEDKVKQLQQDSQKKTLSASPGVEGTSKQMAQNKTRTKGQTIDRSKGAVDKEKLVEVMKERFQELLRQNRSAHSEDLLNKDFYAEQMELENIIKVAAKERLQLEKQLVDEQHNLEIEAQLTKSVHLERRNAELMDEVERLTKFADEREKLEIEVVQRRIEVETLEQQVTEADHKCARLAEELQDLIVRNTQLTVVNTDIQRQIEELDQMARDYKSLSASFAAAESELLKARAEAAACSERVQTLEVELQYMGQVEQKKRQLELEKQSLQESLRLKQLEFDAVNKDREEDNIRNEELLKSLELRLSEIENLYEEQLRINEQMSRELNDVRASKEKNSGKPRQSIEVQTEHELLVTGVAVSHQSLLAHEAVNGDINSAPEDRHHSPSKVIQMDVNRNMSNRSKNLQLTDLISKDDLPNTVVSRSQVLHETADRVIHKGSGVNGSTVENGYADDTVLNDPILDGQESLIQVFQAIFDYDPDESSPNEEPEQELVLTAGDFLFVYNNMDEDGFYLAELLDGRQGLVPSNFVRRVTGQELVEFYAAINMDMQGDGVDFHSSGTNPLLDFSYREDLDLSGSTRVKQSDADRSLDVSFTNDGPDLKQHGIPDAPVNVQVESGPDHGCLMVSWLPVTITTAGTSNGARVAGYYIYIDGCKVKTLSNPTGDHVLLESDDLCLINDPRCITVRTVAVSGQESSDSLPAFIFPHLVQELQAHSVSADDDDMAVHDEKEDEYATDQDSGSETERPETASHPRDLRQMPQPLRPENGNHLLGVENASPSNIQFKEVELRKDMDGNRNEELLSKDSMQNSFTPSTDHSGSLVLQKSRSPEVVPVTAASFVDGAAVCQSDGDGALIGAFTSTVWKKVTPKTKLNTTGNTADLNSVNWNNDERTWKSLDSGDTQNLSSKSQSQECLGNIKRSGWARNSSLMDVNANGEPFAHQMEKSPADAKETRERTVTQKNLHSIPLGTSLIAKDELQRQFDSQDIDNAGGKKPGAGRVGRRNRNVSTSSDVSANNGISQNELDDGVSSSSELVDNNMMTSKKIRDDIPDSELIDYSDDGGESLVESVECDRDAPVRIFIALFSYDPETMSPNPDALSEELPFREGQIIKIYGDKDQDGFFVGEINHQRGLVPCNMVSEVHINDPEIAAQLLEENRRRPASQSAGSSRASSRTSDFTSRTHSTGSTMGVPDDERLSPVGEPSDIDDNVPERYVIALYNYDPNELSPNTDVDEELSFRKGDIIKVFGEVDEDGFYYGQLNDRYGLVPSNFIKEAPSSAVYYAAAMQNRPSL